MERGGEEIRTTEVEAVEGGTETVESPSTESPKRESATESARRAFEELSKEANASGGDGEAREEKENPEGAASEPDAKPDTEQVAEGAQKPAKIKEKPAPEPDYELMAPERLNAEERAMYERLPKVAKRSFKRIVKNMESWAGRNIQEANSRMQRAEAETQELTQVVRPFLPDLYQRGLSVPQAVAKLLAEHSKLTDQDENKRTQRWLELGAESSVNPKILTQIQSLLQGADGGTQDISQHPQFRALQENQKRVESNLEAWQTQQRAMPIAAEMRAVADKVDPVTKQLVYPELQNGALDVAKPLIEALVDRVPGISYAQALECSIIGLRADNSSYDAAYQQACRAYYTGNFNQLNPVRPPTSTQTTQERAVTAGFSARGNSAAGTQHDPDNLGKLPDWAKKNATETARWIVQQRSRGV